MTIFKHVFRCDSISSTDPCKSLSHSLSDFYSVCVAGPSQCSWTIGCDIFSERHNKEVSTNNLLTCIPPLNNTLNERSWRLVTYETFDWSKDLSNQPSFIVCSYLPRYLPTYLLIYLPQRTRDFSNIPIMNAKSNTNLLFHDPVTQGSSSRQAMRHCCQLGHWQQQQQQQMAGVDGR